MPDLQLKKTYHPQSFNISVIFTAITIEYFSWHSPRDRQLFSPVSKICNISICANISNAHHFRLPLFGRNSVFYYSFGFINGNFIGFIGICFIIDRNFIIVLVFITYSKREVMSNDIAEFLSDDSLDDSLLMLRNGGSYTIFTLITWVQRFCVASWTPSPMGEGLWKTAPLLILPWFQNENIRHQEASPQAFCISPACAYPKAHIWREQINSLGYADKTVNRHSRHALFNTEHRASKSSSICGFRLKLHAATQPSIRQNVRQCRG